MKVEIDNKLFGAIVTGVSVVFGAYMYIDNMYVDDNELALSQMEEVAVNESKHDDLQTRVLMSESTRYAQITKYYGDVSKERALTTAEEARRQLAEREQCRIRNILADTETGLCD